ncbi:hypothetical protein T439DRAFT_328245 [Meredithblackwellia eburnea MCA 4105]
MSTSALILLCLLPYLPFFLVLSSRRTVSRWTERVRRMARPQGASPQRECNSLLWAYPRPVWQIVRWPRFFLPFRFRLDGNP